MVKYDENLSYTNQCCFCINIFYHPMPVTQLLLWQWLRRNKNNIVTIKKNHNPFWSNDVQIQYLIVLYSFRRCSEKRNALVIPLPVQVNELSLMRAKTEFSWNFQRNFQFKGNLYKPVSIQINSNENMICVEFISGPRETKIRYT